MPGTLEAKVVLVTGRSLGIGRASAIALAKEGANVVVADVDGENGQTTINMIENLVGVAHFVKTDVSFASEVEMLVGRTVDLFGRLDYAVNNAGIVGGRAPAADCTEEDWDKVIGINLKGAWLCMKYEILQMLKIGGGSIVNIASGAGLVGLTNSAYTASKHAVVGLTKSATISYSKEGIRVNAVCPGYVRTPMIESILQENSEIEPRLGALHPIGRLGIPEEIAAAVVWLCSEAASFVTGHAMAVDGGYVAQ